MTKKERLKSFQIITPAGINVKSEFYKQWEKSNNKKDVWYKLDISKDKFMKEYQCDFKQ